MQRYKNCKIVYLQKLADQRGPRSNAPKLMTVWRKAVRVAVVSSWLGVWHWQWLNLSRIQCRLLQKLQRLWLSHSQPRISEWTGVLEVWTWTYYSAEADIHPMGRKMHQNMHLETEKYFSGEGALWVRTYVHCVSLQLCRSADVENTYYRLKNDLPTYQRHQIGKRRKFSVQLSWKMSN